MLLSNKILIGWSTVILPVTLLLSPTAFAQTDPSGAWLDAETNWNTTGATVPESPSFDDGNNLSNCELGVRPAALPEDAQVEAAGWTLTGAAQINGATTLVQGMADADGMCRPLKYQVFVFTDGEFTGTLSPTPMDARTDGSLIRYDLYRQGYIGAVFARYQPSDALCCASATSRLFYQVETEAGQPLLVPQLPADTTAGD